MMRTLLSFAVVAHAARAGLDVSPVEKVVTLLEDLRNQVQSEGSDEAATYDKFACFCKDKNNAKVESIQNGEMEVTSLTASLVDLEATKAELTADISSLTTEIARLESDLKKATEIREQEHAVYAVAFADAEAAVNALQSAIAHITGSKQAGLVEVKAQVQKTLALADALNIKVKNTTAVAAFLQQPFEAPAEGEPDYQFHSDGIVSTLEDLLEKFSKQKDALQAEEEKAAAAFDAAAKAKREEIEASKATLETKEGELSDTETRIAEDTESLTEAKALLADDKTYLKDLTGQCETKAREWDQRSSLRNQELEALTKALEIITGTVQEKESLTGAGGRSDATPVVEAAEEAPAKLFVHTARKAKKGFIQQADPDAEAEDYTDVVFTQTGVVRKHSEAAAVAKRNQVISLLKLKGQELKSTAIALLTMKLAADPFAKVKTLIQQLIERLLREAANEATHKGWCDTEIGKAESDRDFRHEDIMQINADITSLEARKASLENEIAKLQEELLKLNADLNEATQLRGEEKAENKETLVNSSEGLVAVKQAIEVLKEFYGKTSRRSAATVSLVQASPVDQDMASEGAGTFSGAYKGNQAQGAGIIGMLETIASDFERTTKNTEAAEAEAHRNFIEYERETKVSIATKETGLSQAQNDLVQTNGDLVAALNDLQSNQKLLDASLETLEKLRPACVDTGMSYEERVERREAEIAALKNAVCVLDEEDAAIGNCSGGKWTGGFLQK